MALDEQKKSVRTSNQNEKKNFYFDGTKFSIQTELFFSGKNYNFYFQYVT